MENKEDFLSAFERTQEKGDLKLTKEEAEKFKNAFEDPEFCKLMSEYVEDLQNPEYRAETESYINQLESEDKVPQGKELIRPIKGFVAKSRKRDKNDKKDSKVFINIVQSEKITEPSKTDTDKGQNWSLPYSLGPPHMEKDNKNDAVVAFDCCFHPDALSMAKRYKAFRDLLVSTAIQGIEEACKLQNQITTVNKEFTILKGVTYKSGEVPTMMVDLTAKENKWNSDRSQTDDVNKAPPPPSKEEKVTEAQDEPSAIDMVTALEEASSEGTTTQSKGQSQTKTKSKPAIKKGFLNNPKNAGSIYPSGSNEGNRGTPPRKPLVEELPEGYKPKSAPPAVKVTKKQEKPSETPLLTAKTVTRKVKDNALATAPEKVDDKSPKYTLVERGILGLGDFEGGNSSHKKKPVSNRPEELVYKIEIPLVTKTSKVELDVGEREIKMKYLDVYDLHIQLPYSVYEKKGGAKFDKEKKLLTITLPVQPYLGDGNFDTVEVETNEKVEEVSKITNRNVDEEVTQPRKMHPKKVEKVHERWLSPDNDKSKMSNETHDEPRVEELQEGSESKKETLSEEIARKAKEAVAEAKRLKEMEEMAQREKGKLRSDESSSQTDLKGESSTTDNKEGCPVSNDASFIPSGTYVGTKKGYVFKKGDEGLGYYIDGGDKSSQESLIIDSLDSMDISKSLVDYSKIDKENKNANKCMSWNKFDFQFRQTKEAIAMIIDVKCIIAESVQIDFSSKSFDVYFAAVESSDAKDEKKTVDYALSFDCMKELDIPACKFDVATQNMVVILQKKVHEFWIRNTSSDDKQNSDNVVITSRDFSGSVLTEKNTKNDASTSCGSDDKSNPKVSEKSTAALLNEMKFGVQGLLDLD